MSTYKALQFFLRLRFSMFADTAHVTNVRIIIIIIIIMVLMNIHTT